MIEVEGLSKKYGPIEAISDLAFKVEKGDVMGFLGPNGAGKTTTMRILTGYMPASSGKAIVAGHDVSEQAVEVKKRIGYLPELPPLYGYMTVESYLEHVAELKKVEKKARPDAVERALTKTNLQDVRGRLIDHLSKGYKQRIGIAQAIIHDPEVLILDEPTIGLDPRQIVEIREMIRGLAGEHTIVLSTHILSEVSRICNKVIVINRGKIVAADAIDNLKKSHSIKTRLRLRISADGSGVESKLLAIPGVTGVSKDEGAYLIECERDSKATDKIARAALDGNWGLQELAMADMTVEDIFLKIIDEAEAARKNQPAAVGAR